MAEHLLTKTNCIIDNSKETKNDNNVRGENRPQSNFQLTSRLSIQEESKKIIPSESQVIPQIEEETKNNLLKKHKSIIEKNKDLSKELSKQENKNLEKLTNTINEEKYKICLEKKKSSWRDCNILKKNKRKQ